MPSSAAGSGMDASPLDSAAAELQSPVATLPLPLPATEVPSSGDAGRGDDAEQDAWSCRLVGQLESARQLVASHEIKLTEVPFGGADIHHYCALADYNFY